MNKMGTFRWSCWTCKLKPPFWKAFWQCESNASLNHLHWALGNVLKCSALNLGWVKGRGALFWASPRKEGRHKDARGQTSVPFQTSLGLRLKAACSLSLRDFAELPYWDDLPVSPPSLYFENFKHLKKFEGIVQCTSLCYNPPGFGSGWHFALFASLCFHKLLFWVYFKEISRHYNPPPLNTSVCVS